MNPFSQPCRRSFSAAAQTSHKFFLCQRSVDSVTDNQYFIAPMQHNRLPVAAYLPRESAADVAGQPLSPWIRLRLLKAQLALHGKQIQILCESDEYYIVATGSDYGLSNYDHIALNGEDVKENDVVFQ